MIYDDFRVTGAHDAVLDYADWFFVTLRDANIQEFDTRWDEVLLSMSKTLSDDILESLYKLRIRESDQLKTVLELYDLEIHQKKLGPDCHYQWKEKDQFARRPLQFPPRDPRSCAKPEHTAATLSEPTASRGRSASRKRSIRGKGNNGSIP